MISVRDHMTLAIAAQHFRYSGAFESTVSRELGYSLPRYAVVLAALIRRPDVEAAYPALTHRLRRLEDRRREARRSPRLSA